MSRRGEGEVERLVLKAATRSERGGEGGGGGGKGGV